MTMVIVKDVLRAVKSKTRVRVRKGNEVKTTVRVRDLKERTKTTVRKLSLDVVSDGDANRPVMPRPELKELTRRVLAAPTLADAASLLERTAEGLPQTPHTWGYYLLKLARGLAAGEAAFSIFVEGNIKLPFFAFSALPEFTCPGAGDCLSWCYSFTGWRYPATWARQLQNTLLLKHKPEHISDAFGLLPHGVILRLYVDGDFDSERTVALWMHALATRPDIQSMLSVTPSRPTTC
jgi:hypothetical protein